MRAIGYVRVSTAEQTNHYGLDIQRDQIEAKAAQLGIPLSVVYTDDGVSGTKDAAQRPGLAALIRACGPDVTVIVPRLDRLARDLIVQENVLTAIWQTGAQVVSCDETEARLLHKDAVDDPTRRLLRMVMGAVYQFQRDMTVAALQRARQWKKSQGGYVGATPPYGWKSKRGSGRLFPDEREQMVIKLVVALHRDGLTFKEVAEELNRRGYRNRAGTPFQVQQVHRIWKREVQAGRARPVDHHQNRKVRPLPIKPKVRAVNSVRSS